jgi:hypothetical protein
LRCFWRKKNGRKENLGTLLLDCKIFVSLGF